MTDYMDQLRSVAAAGLFPDHGDMTARGLVEPAEVRRDAWGVPYIRAGSLDDLWFAHGMVTAGERLFQLDLLLRAANGRLSEVFADRTLADDRFARTIGFHRAGRRLAAAWDDDSHRMHERFREGVFAWIGSMPASPVEYALLDLTPELPRDEAAWASAFSYLAWTLSGNWDAELLRTWIRERAGEEAAATLLPPSAQTPPQTAPGALRGELAHAFLEAAPRPRGQGSNAWVVAGSRTATGKPLLANDPHLLALQPGAWLECHLSAPGYQARGVALTFSPGVLLGTTAHHAWGVTNVSGDVQDLYLERLNEDRTAADHEDGWEPLTTHRETIAIRGSGRPHELEVRESRHGPLIDAFASGLMHPEYVELAPSETYALRWAGSEHGLRPSIALAAARATSFEEFREAALGVACPGQNFVYADIDGTIGYACTGAFPIRRAGDGTAPVPGWTAEHEWDGWIPGDELPWAKDPDRGFLVTANNRPHVDAYPHLIGLDFHAPHRATRIATVLDESDGHTIEDMARLQNDTVSLPARQILPMLLELPGRDEEQRRALDLLRGWDGDMAAASAPAVVFTVWSRAIARRVLEPLLGADLFRHYLAWREPFQCDVLPALLRERNTDGAWIDDELLITSLADAIGELRERLGDDPDGWSWGSIHRLRLAHALASIPGLEPLFTAADLPFGGDEQTVMQGGFDGRNGYDAAVIPSWRVVYDLADLDRSIGVLPAGVSGNPASPHWNDQVDRYAVGAYHPLPFTREAVEAATVASLRLVPYHP
jgi:penicillin G amidase